MYKQTTKKLFLSLAAGSCLLLAACGGGGGSAGDGGSNTAPAISRIAIQDAEMLFLASSSRNDEALVKRSASSGERISRAAEEPEQTVTTLYKMTDEGLVVEVELYDEDGELVENTTHTPSMVRELNDNYMLVAIDFGDLAINGPAYYLVSKTTGAAYFWWGQDPENEQLLKVMNIYTGLGWLDLNPSSFYVDQHGNSVHEMSRDNYVVADGNVYVNIQDDCTSNLCDNSWTNRVHRLNDQDPSSLNTEALSPVSDLVQGKVMVDTDGALIYQLEGSEDLRVVKAAGGLERISEDDFLVGLSNDSEAREVLPLLRSNGEASVLARITVPNPNYPATGELPYTFDGARLFTINASQGSLTEVSRINQYIVESRSAIMRATEETLLLGRRTYGSAQELDQHYLLSMENSTGALSLAATMPENFTVTSTPLFALNDDVLYLADGRRQVFRIDLTDYSFTKLLDADDYETKKVSITGNGSLIANALRLSDGAEVTLRVPVDGELEVLGVLSNQSIISLIRVH